MNLIKLLNNPILNAIFVGIIIYLLIVISNAGNPVLGSILSSFPVGLLGLLAINKDDIKSKYIKNAVFVNIVIVIMWICMYALSTKYGNKKIHLLYGFLIWVILSVLYYFYMRHYK